MMQSDRPSLTSLTYVQSKQPLLSHPRRAFLPPSCPSQTCELVLGAGAMRTAGLKSISAKHLAISCEAVHLLAVMLPQLRAGLIAPVVQQQRRTLLLPEFDHLMKVGSGSGCRAS